MPKAVILDLFETLVSEVGVGHPSAEQVARTLGLDPQRFRQHYDSLRPARYTGEFADFATLIETIATGLGVAADPGRIEEAVNDRRLHSHGT